MRNEFLPEKQWTGYGNDEEVELLSEMTAQIDLSTVPRINTLGKRQRKGQPEF